MEKRVKYNELKQWFFDEAYEYCHIKFINGKINAWSNNENEWGGALYSFDNSFERTIENLMVDVLYIITNGVENKLSHQIVFKKIKNTLSEYDINDLIKDLDEKEKEEFLFDLNLALNYEKIKENKKIKYQELKKWIFNDVYTWKKIDFKCQLFDKTFFYYTCENKNIFEYPLNNLMFCTINIIKNAGRNRKYHNDLMKIVDSILEKKQINNLISELDDEDSEFIYDLNLILNNRDIEPI